MKRCIELMQKSVALDDSSGEAHAGLGYWLVLARQYDNAVAEGERGMALEPNSAGVLQNYAAILTFVGRREEAIPLFREALRLNPAYTDARKKLALVHFQHGDLDRAMAELDTALETSPGYPDLHKIRGDILAHRGDAGGARVAYDRAASINPDYAEAIFGLVIALRREGRGREADQTLRRFISNHPDHVMARTLLTVDKIPVGEG